MSRELLQWLVADGKRPRLSNNLSSRRHANDLVSSLVNVNARLSPGSTMRAPGDNGELVGRFRRGCPGSRLGSIPIAEPNAEQ